MRARLLLIPTALSLLGALLLFPADAAITPTVPVTISGAGSQASGSHVLDVDASGRAIAVWLETVDGVVQLRSAERAAGGAWSASVDLTTGTLPVSGFALDVNEAGDAAVVFRRADSGASQHWLWGIHRASASATWGSASAFGGLTHGLAQNGDFGVAVMSDGTAVAAYEAPDAAPGPLSTTYRAYAGQGSASGWSGGVLISDTGHLPVNGDEVQRHVTAIAIAADGAGNARVLMRMEARSPSTFGTRHRLMRTTRTTTTGWTTIAPITSITDADYAAPSIPRVEGDPGAAGGFVEVWSEITDDGVDVVVASVGGDRQTFEDDDADPATNDDMFSAEMSMRGGVAAINTIYNRPVEVGQDSVSRVGTAVWRAGVGWSALMDPVEDPEYGATRPRLSVHPDGTLSQVYDTGTGFSADVLVSQLPPGTSTWTADRTVSVYPEARADFRASVAATADGAVVIWSRSQSGTPAHTVEAVSFTGSDTASPTPTTPTSTTSSPSPTVPGPVPPTTTAPIVPPAPTVAPPSSTSFVKVTSPSVAGRAVVGRTLKANAGRWQPVPAKVAYQWRAGTKNIKKATKANLKLTPALKGKKISVRITLSAPGRASVTVTVKVKGTVR